MPVRSFIATLLFLTVPAMAQDMPALTSGDEAPFPGFLYDAGPALADIYQFPPDPEAGERVRVTLRAFPPEGLPSRPVMAAYLHYRFGEGDWNRKAMIRDDADKDFFMSYIPPSAAGEAVTWYVSAEDLAGNVTSEVPLSKNMTFQNMGAGQLVRVRDTNEPDDIVPGPIDAAEILLGRNEDGIVLHLSTDAPPESGNMAKEGAYGYALFALPAEPYVGLGNILSGGGDIPAILHAPLLSAMLGIPKAAMVNAKDLMSGKGEIGGAGLEFKKLKSGLRFQFNLENEKANFREHGLKTAAVTIALKQGSTDFWPWEATPYLTAYFREHSYTTSAPGGKSGGLKAGAAWVDLTPPIGTPLCGFGARMGKPSTGKHDPIRGDALYLESGPRPEERFMIVTTDLTLLRRNLYKDVTKGIEEKTGVPRTNIILTASHSHASFGALFPEVAVLGGKYDPAVYRATVEGLVKAGVEAAAKPRPARMTVASGLAPGASSNREYDDGPADPEVGVVKVDALDGGTIAVLVNFTAHPTVIGGMEFSADYPGYIRKEIEEKLPGAVALFANGAQGDQGPGCAPGDCGAEWERIERLGRYIGGQALAAAKDAQPLDAPKIRMEYHDLLLGPSQDARSAQSALRIGDNVLVTVPGEMFVELGLGIKERAHAAGLSHAFVLGLSDDSIGYMQTPGEYRKHKYTTVFTIFGANEGEFIQSQAIRLIERSFDR